jgi:catechol 2,3-dioxygenase-like lactoylglutathione lyase family enzyme
MPAAEYARTLGGLGLNLLVRDVARQVRFLTGELDFRAVYSDPDFAVLRCGDDELLLHADHTYEEHPFGRSARGGARGAGVEIRLYDADPDQAVARAASLGGRILVPPADKGHGLREAYIEGPDGYVWVPSRALRG